MQFGGQRFLGIFGPAQPDLAYLHSRPHLACLGEAGDMVPMLVCHDQHIDLSLRHLSDVFSHLTHDDGRVGRAFDHAGVDDEMKRLARRTRRAEQKAITQTVAIDANTYPLSS